EKGHALKRGLQCPSSATDLAKQGALPGEMPGRPGQDTAHEVETVIARRQGKPWLVSMLRRQARHAASIDVGRIADDQVVAPPAPGREQIAAMKRDAILQPMAFDIAPRQRQRLGRKVGGIDAGMRKGERSQDGKTARAGTEIEYTANAAG